MLLVRGLRMMMMMTMMMMMSKKLIGELIGLMEAKLDCMITIDEC
jgi:hypothetical protein